MSALQVHILRRENGAAAFVHFRFSVCLLHRLGVDDNLFQMTEALAHPRHPHVSIRNQGQRGDDVGRHLHEYDDICSDQLVTFVERGCHECEHNEYPHACGDKAGHVVAVQHNLPVHGSELCAVFPELFHFVIIPVVSTNGTCARDLLPQA